MISRRKFTLASFAAAAGCGVLANVYGDRLGLGSKQAQLEKAAEKEGALRIDVATGLLNAEDLMNYFKRMHPNIALDLRRASSRELHLSFMQEISNGQPTADIIISPAMDLQFKLINDGFAQTYVSPEKAHLPDWAVWKDQAYAISADPLVFAYNKKLVPPEDVPQSHHEFTDLLRRKGNLYQGKVASYDPERSGTGYLYYTQDLLLSRDTLDFVQAVGRTQPKLYVAGSDVRNKVSAGEHWLAYNMVKSYMMVREDLHPDVAIVYPSDYTLMVLRIAFIPKTARHPAAGKLFLDFLLSQAGQTLMAQELMLPTRNGVAPVGETPSAEVVRRIHFGPALLANLDEFRRRRVLYEWRRAFES